jgi:shikimate kinase
LLLMTDETVFSPSTRNAASVSTVVLVGFMGAGKTTIGSALARKLGWRFADLDQLIEAEQGSTVPEIFEQHGESRFRDLECEALTRALVADCSGMVLALGGGAFVNENIRQLLRQHGIPAIWLDAPAEELFRRCEQPEVVRPLRRDREQFARLYEQRLSSYRQSDLHVITTDKEISFVVEEIVGQFAFQPGVRSFE